MGFFSFCDRLEEQMRIPRARGRLFARCSKPAAWIRILRGCDLYPYETGSDHHFYLCSFAAEPGRSVHMPPYKVFSRQNVRAFSKYVICFC